MSIDVFVPAHGRDISMFEATVANYIMQEAVLAFFWHIEYHTVHVRFGSLVLLLNFCTWEAHSISTINMVNLKRNAVRFEFKIS